MVALPAMHGLLGFVKDIFHGLRPSSAMSQQHQHQRREEEEEAPSSPPRIRRVTHARRRQLEEAASQRGKQGRRTPPQQDAEAISGCIPRQQQLTRQVLSLLGQGANRRYGEELMRLILTKGRATLDVQLAFPDETDSEGEEEEEEEEDGGRGKRIHADLELGYQGEAYACMDEDKWRNLYFRRAIAAASGAALPPFPPAFPIAAAPASQQEQEDGKERGGSTTTIDSSNSSSSNSSSGSDSSSSDDRPKRRRGGGRAEAAPLTLLASSQSPSPGPPSAGGTEETWTGRKRSWRAALLLSSPCAVPASSSLSSSPLFPTGANAAAAAKEEEKGARRWLEIGPGAMGTLSRMVLDADRHNTLLAIEAVPHSARALEAGLREAYPPMPVPEGEEGAKGKKWASASPTRPRPPKCGRASKGVAARAFAFHVVSGAGTISSSGSAALLPRFRVVQGLAGHVRLPPCVGGHTYEALVAEVLGHLASSEGYVAILHQMGRAHPTLARRLRVAIPRFFGTKWAPVDLLAAGEDDRALRIAALEERLALFEAFPLHACRLPLMDGGDDGVMERYDALEELRLGAADHRRCTSSSGSSSGKGRGSPSPLGPRVFPPSTWTVAAAAAADKGEEEGERPFHGLACYIAFGEDSCPKLDAPFPRLASSRAVDPYRCTNWCNVFLPVGGGAWRVRTGDRIVARARCHVHLAEPHYDVHVAVHRPCSYNSGDGSGVGGGGGGGGRSSGVWASEGPAAGCVVVYEEELCVRYRDLLGRVDTVRAFLRRRERGEWR